MYMLVVEIRKINGQCHGFNNCFCVTGIVSCSGLTKFPTSFPADSTTITVSHFNVDEIPPKSFSDLPVLESVEIFSGNISKISSYAFSGLSDFDRISFGNINIGTIESSAFTDLSDFGTLSVYASNIETINSKAFSNIFALDKLQIFSSNITAIRTEAFYMLEEVLKFSFLSNEVGLVDPYIFSVMLNLGTFEMYQNTIETFGCGFIEYAVKNAEKSSIHANNFACGCHVSTLLKNENIKKHMYSNWCTDPVEGTKVVLDKLYLDKEVCSDECQSVHKTVLQESETEGYLTPRITPKSEYKITEQTVAVNSEKGVKTTARRLITGTPDPHLGRNMKKNTLETKQQQRTIDGQPKTSERVSISSTIRKVYSRKRFLGILTQKNASRTMQELTNMPNREIQNDIDSAHNIGGEIIRNEARALWTSKEYQSTKDKSTVKGNKSSNSDSQIKNSSTISVSSVETVNAVAGSNTKRYVQNSAYRRNNEVLMTILSFILFLM